MSIYDNINAGKYKNQLPYPSIQPVLRLMNRAAKDLTAAELAEVAAYRENHEKVEQQYRDARLLYNHEEARLNRLFFDDLAIEHGVTGNPKLEKLESLSWEHGHSSGLSDVASYYSDFVELIK